MTIEERAAEAAHDVVSVYRAAVGMPTEAAWADLDSPRKELLAALAALAPPCGSLAEYHGLARALMLDAGWTWGAVDDTAAKVSPELAPWDEITDTTRAILTLAWSTARTVTRALVDAGMT